MENKIKKLLYYCLANDLKERLFGVNAQLFIITMKSLMPFENKIGCGINYYRNEKELELLNYYANNNEKMDYSYLDRNFTCNIKDEFTECSILALGLSNTNWNIIIDEVLKNIIYYKVDDNNIISSIVLSRIVFEYINDDLDEDKLLQSIKESIINFSFKDFIIRNSNKKLDTKKIIEIERNKIYYLENIEKHFKNENVIFQKSRIFEYIILGRNEEILNKDNKRIIDNFASYIMKLRKGKISPEKLYIDTNKIRPLETYLINKTFNHPLLGKCMVISKNIENEILIKTKTGLIKVRK